MTSTDANPPVCGTRLVLLVDAAVQTAPASAMVVTLESIVKCARLTIMGKVARGRVRTTTLAARMDTATNVVSVYVHQISVESHAIRAFRPLDKDVIQSVVGMSLAVHTVAAPQVKLARHASVFKGTLGLIVLSVTFHSQGLGTM
jgi:hypothetical protein